jgi:hypothetical protein
MNVIMDPEVERILAEARRLPILRRAALAASILETLDEAPSPDAKCKWDEEADLRLQELEDGRVKPISSDTLRERILGDECPPAS